MFDVIKNEDELLRPREVAEMLKVSGRTFERRVKDGTVPAPVWVGRHRRWWKSAVAARLQHPE